ncbi:MAG: flavodoxin [Candidatus Thorarchaeota archaeon]
MDLREKQCLIAFYSRKGNNYVNGSIVNLEIGNTEVIAKMINELIESDMFYINTIKPYPQDYEETTKVAKQELKSNARPELSDHIADMKVYHIIFLGYPNWWGTMPMVVRSFLESYNFSDKIIIPFCTHEGSGLGSSVKDIAQLCPKAEIKNAISFRGGNVKNARGEVEKWIQKCQI